MVSKQVPIRGDLHIYHFLFTDDTILFCDASREQDNKKTTQKDYVCVCLDFLKPKTRINEKVGNKMRLVEPKTQLFKKSCVLGSGKIHVQNALHLWTSEVHK